MASNRERSTTTHDLALVTLRQAILDGTIEPGARLRQEDIATFFAASRIPVRGALRALEFDGLVSSEPHRGFTVSRLDGDEIEEIYELRAILEGHAVRLAVPLLTEGDHEALGRLFEAMLAATDSEAELARRELFYMRLFAVPARGRLLSLIEHLRKDVSRPLRWKLVAHSPVHHQVFFDAVKRGDSEAAAEELSIHYSTVAALLRRYLRDTTSGGPRPPESYASIETHDTNSRRRAGAA